MFSFLFAPSLFSPQIDSSPQVDSRPFRGRFCIIKPIQIKWCFTLGVHSLTGQQIRHCLYCANFILKINHSIPYSGLEKVKHFPGTWSKFPSSFPTFIMFFFVLFPPSGKISLEHGSQVPYFFQACTLGPKIGQGYEKSRGYIKISSNYNPIK